MDDVSRAFVGQLIQLLLGPDQRVQVSGADILCDTIKSDLWTLRLVADDARMVPQLVCLMKETTSEAKSAATRLLHWMWRAKEGAMYEIACAFDTEVIQALCQPEHKPLFDTFRWRFETHSIPFDLAHLRNPSDFTAAVKRANDAGDDQERERMKRVIQDLNSSDPSTQARGAKTIKDVSVMGYLWVGTALAENGVVITRLLHVLREGGDTARSDAHLALRFLAETGEEAKVRITDQLDHSVIAALAKEPEQRLLSSLMKSARAAAVITSKHSSNVIPILTRGIQEENEEMLDAMAAMVASWFTPTSSSTDVTSVCTRDAVLRALEESIYGPNALKGLQQSPSAIIDLLQILKTSDEVERVKKLSAMIWLAHAMQTSETARRTFVREGGLGIFLSHIAAPGETSAIRAQGLGFLMMLRRTSCELFEAEPETLDQLRTLPAEDAFGLLIFAIADIAFLIGATSDPKAAFHQLMASKYAMECIVLSLYHVVEGQLRTNPTTTSQMTPPEMPQVNSNSAADDIDILADLERSLFSSCTDLCDGGNNSRIARFVRVGGVWLLTTLPQVQPSVQARVNALLHRLSTALLPQLLSRRLDLDSLRALEVMAQKIVNQQLSVWKDGVGKLGAVINGSDAVLKPPAARTLANLACKHDENRASISRSSVMGGLVTMLSSPENATRVAAAMTIRNLAGGHKDRDSITCVGALPALVDMLRKGQTSQERVVAAGALGNLARDGHAAYQYFIVQSGAIEALVEALGTSSGLKLKAISATALAVLVKGPEWTVLEVKISAHVASGNSSYTSLREFVMQHQTMQPSTAISPECGRTKEDASVLQALPAEIVWQHGDNEGFTLSHEGPCEIWCDDERVFAEKNCAKTYPQVPAKLPYERAKCQGKTRLQMVWLALHEGPRWQVYMNCAPLVGANAASSKKLSPSPTVTTSNVSAGTVGPSAGVSDTPTASPRLSTPTIKIAWPSPSSIDSPSSSDSSHDALVHHSSTRPPMKPVSSPATKAPIKMNVASEEASAASDADDMDCVDHVSSKPNHSQPTQGVMTRPRPLPTYPPRRASEVDMDDEDRSGPNEEDMQIESHNQLTERATGPVPKEIYEEALKDFEEEQKRKDGRRAALKKEFGYA